MRVDCYILTRLANTALRSGSCKEREINNGGKQSNLFPFCQGRNETPFSPERGFAILGFVLNVVVV